MRLSKLIPSERVCGWGAARSGLHCTATLCLALVVIAIEACSSIDPPFNPLASPESDIRPATPAVSEAQTPHESLSSQTDVRKPQSAQIDSLSDSVLSGELTYYLKGDGLPLVGAQVCSNDSGDMWVILYGFVATRFGKDDAEEKARRILGDPYVPIDDRVMIRSDLAATASSPPGTASPGANHFVQGETPEIGYLYAAPTTKDDASE
jgi:hypothetical protein